MKHQVGVRRILINKLAARPVGRKQYAAERTQWRKFAATVERVLDAT